MALSITFEATAVQEALSALPTRILNGTARAINQAIAGTRRFMLERMSADTGIPSLMFEPALSDRRATPARLDGEVSARGRRGVTLIPILQLRATQIGQGPKVPGGVMFQFAGQTKTIPNAFIARMRARSGRTFSGRGWTLTFQAGHRGVFTRVSRARLPIIEEKGPAIRTVFELSEERGRAFAEHHVAERLERELQGALRG